MRAFISSAIEELRDARAQAALAVDDLAVEPVMWETLPAASRTAREQFLEHVRNSDFYVGIFWNEYSEGAIEEYNEATEAGIPRLLFVKRTESRDGRLDAFIRSLRPEVRYNEFSTDSSLYVRVQQAVDAELRSRHVNVISRSSGLRVIGNSIVHLIDEKGVLYLREMQLNLENEFYHWDTTNFLRTLVGRSIIKTRKYRGLRWFYKLDWSAVLPEVEKKLGVVRVYANHDNRFVRGGVRYDDYSEYLVAEALSSSGFVILGRNVTGRSGRENVGPGRPTDLDFLVRDPRTSTELGVQVKNRLVYPSRDSVVSFVELCERQGVRPLLIVRRAPPSTLGIVRQAGGYFVVFNRWMLRPPFPRDVFKAAVEDLGVPIGVYRRMPDFLVRRLEEVRRKLRFG